MAAMLVPVANIAGSGFWPVSRRLVHRIAGCAAGAIIGLAFLRVSLGHTWILLLGTAVSVVVGRLIENGARSRAYVGTQLVLAALMVLVPDDYADAALAPAIARIVGILIGFALLEPVLLIWHVAAPRRRVTSPDPDAFEPGGP